MRKHLYVDNIDLSTYGVYISGQGTFGSGAKEYNYYNIPGRNGSVLGYRPRLENVNVTYPAGIYTNFSQNIRDLRSLLLSREGYVKINDDYDTTHFRLGAYTDEFTPDVTQLNDAGQFDITFNCRPERWLNTGETTVTYTPSGSYYTLTNPTRFTSRPNYRIYGYGTVSCTDTSNYGTVIEVISDFATDFSNALYIDINGEDMSAYAVFSLYKVRVDNYVQYYVYEGVGTPAIFGVDPPVLVSGTNRVRVSGANLTKVEITPRWWEV